MHISRPDDAISKIDKVPSSVALITAIKIAETFMTFVPNCAIVVQLIYQTIK